MYVHCLLFNLLFKINLNTLQILKMMLRLIKNEAEIGIYKKYSHCECTDTPSVHDYNVTYVALLANQSKLPSHSFL